MAIKWADDGWGLYMLHGVRVPEWLVVERAEKIDPVKITEIDNADIRREFCRKVGMERICYKLGAKTIDSAEFENKSGRFNYDLISLNLPHGSWRYLKFQSASLPEYWHVEGVPNEVGSVRAAIAFRNSINFLDVDDINGEDYYQHGDVILKPKGAKKLKLFPAWIA